MREGLLYDMLGRFKREDARERTVRAMQQRYHVDIAQAERVEATARNFLEQTRRGLEARRSARAPRPEVGGATARDRARCLAQRLPPPRRLSARERATCRVPARGAAAARPAGRRPSTQARAGGRRGAGTALGPQRRLSDRAAAPRGAPASGPQLHRASAASSCPPRTRSLEMRFPARWLREHPLTSADLQQEVDYLRLSGFRLRVFSGREPDADARGASHGSASDLRRRLRAAPPAR